MLRAAIFLAALILAATALPLRAGIDFTLGSRQDTAAAPDPDNRFITDGNNRIYLRIPAGWQAVGSSGKLDFRPGPAGSEVEVSQVGGVQALPLDPGGLAALRKTIQAALPSGAKDVTPVGEVNDLLPVFGWKSFEATYEFEFFGLQMRRSVLYVNMIPGRVVQVNVTAPVPDFDKIHEQMRKMMFGWFEPKRDLPPDEARQYEEGGFKGG